jgi:alkylation response protein AidB-like acyl-CoA dehydrogenase
VDLSLSDEQRLISETARKFADEVIVPRVRDNDRAQRFDSDLARRIGEMGYLGAPIAEEYGGRGLDHVSYALIVEQVGRADSASRTVVSVQTSLVCGSIERWGTEEQKRRWLPGLCSGELFGCFGLTEPDSGSDAASMRTRAEKVDGGWRINGQKMWISLGNVADVALVFAQTGPERKHRGLACFLVPTETPGFSSEEIHGKLGLRASDTASLAFDDLEAPDDALLGDVGDGFKIAMSGLDGGRYSVAAGCVGICDGCVEASVAYATESAVECANAAIQVHGGAGYVDDHPVERYLRDARVTTLFEGTSQIQKLIIGRAATGVDAILPHAPEPG